MNAPLDDPLPTLGAVTQFLPSRVILAPGRSWEHVTALTQRERERASSSDGGKEVIYVIDDYFDVTDAAQRMGSMPGDLTVPVSTVHEPSTTAINYIMDRIRTELGGLPSAVVGFGGGCALDTAKAVSNLLTNDGHAEDYQGWDLLTNPGVTKFGVPTISGTGAESSRTCVISNASSGVKLGMNSEFSMFNAIVLDPDLTESVPPDQYFYTGMDTFMHCIESLNGRFRNPIADSLSRQALTMVREVFQSDEMMRPQERLNLMVASALGGMAIAGSYVGLIHPVSAALSVIFGTHHGLSNCIVMRAMEPFYPREYEEFWTYVERHGVHIPYLEEPLDEVTLERLVQATLVHERPLSNALGPQFRQQLADGGLENVFLTLGRPV